MHIDIWGPRTGKTTSRAVPAILGAPGGVLVTSNKRDVVDATRDVREGVSPVWVFDPQGIALEKPSWWWNPLSYVTDEVKAAKLADHFASGSRDPGAKTDAYFDPAGKISLRDSCSPQLSMLDHHRCLRLVDAAYGGRAGVDPEPARLPTHGRPGARCHHCAREAARRHLRHGATDGVVPHQPSGGLVGKPPDADRPPPSVRPRRVRTRRWHALLTVEGGPRHCRSSRDGADGGRRRGRGGGCRGVPGGRLAVPLLGVLDEAANVCRWRELPNLYSHYGSRGIVLMTILQSWSQGVDVWGESGMRKLWSASNVKVYGGGVAEEAFLESLSKLIGDFDRKASSVSSGRGGRSVNQQLHRERILDVADLSAMPKGRAVVLSLGTARR